MITLNTHTTSEINQKATHILFDQMGIVDSFKFLNQFTLGNGNYTEERSDLLKDLSLDEIIIDIKARRKDK